MAIINLDSEKIKNINLQISSLDDVLLKNYYPELKSELANIDNNIQGDELKGVISKLLSQFEKVESDLYKSLPKLEQFLDEQVKAYVMTEEELHESLDSVLSKMQAFTEGKTTQTNSERPISPVQEFMAQEILSRQSSTSTSSIQKPVVIQPVAEVSTTPVQESVVAQTVSEASTTPVQEISATSNYVSNPSAGFNVTSGNKTYQLSASDKDLLMAIVAAEADKSSKDDCLAVASVILNRCENTAWVNSHGSNPISQATAPNQFVVYQEGLYKKYLNGNVPDSVKTAVEDALNGIRNCNYLSFRSNGSKSYSSNMISPTGNRYA